MQTPGLAGVVTTRFTVDLEGKVSASAASGIGDQWLEQCIADRIKQIDFPKPHQQIEIVYPLKLVVRSPAGFGFKS
jgi:hypothetical protein